MMGIPLRLDDGQNVCIVSPGVHNNDAGPDFSGAVLKIGDRTWAGNVEIHVKASDWFRHGHHKDPAYDNIILHVVAVNDAVITRSDGSPIPQVCAAPPSDFYYTYAMLQSEMKGVRCASRLSEIPPLLREDWLETLAMQRLQQKAARLADYLSRTGGDWEQALFIALGRALGFGLNSIPFEMLAGSVPLKFMGRHADNLLQVEAILFGQAGMLDPALHPFDSYYQALCQEYAFLRHKYDLNPMRGDLWKYSRTRPGNFPHRRIALLAAAIHDGVRLTSSILEAAGDYDRLTALFSIELSGYWTRHNSFGDDDSPRPVSLSRGSIESLMINLAAPFYLAYSRLTGDAETADRAVDLLSVISPERNSIISAWEAAGLKADSALRSQALLHLRREYCERERCLECRFGHRILRHRATATPPDTALSPYAEPTERIGRRGILVATDSFKGCLSSTEAAEAIAEGISLGCPGALVETAAVADGGEGMAEAIGLARNLPVMQTDTFDPLMRPLKASWRMDPSIGAAFIDMAAASGLTLLDASERSAMETTSYGTGVVIADAIAKGCRTIVAGLGGTATSDAGLGILQALGAEISLDGDILPTASPVKGKDLGRVTAIDISAMQSLLGGVRLMLACDVKSPLTGPRGAVMLFAPQKGADSRELPVLERGMTHLAEIIRDISGKDLTTTPGAGAAGGAGGSLMALAGGEIFSGAEIVAHCIGLRDRIKGKALVITGEGSADRQTLEGKLPAVIMRMAADAGVPTILMAGRIEGRTALTAKGFADAICINDSYPPIPDATDPAVAAERLRTAAANLVKSGAAIGKIRI